MVDLYKRWLRCKKLLKLCFVKSVTCGWLSWKFLTVKMFLILNTVGKRQKLSLFYNRLRIFTRLTSYKYCTKTLLNVLKGSGVFLDLSLLNTIVSRWSHQLKGLWTFSPVVKSVLFSVWFIFYMSFGWN